MFATDSLWMTQTLSKEHLMLMNEELDHRVIINAPFIRLQLHCTFTALPLVQCRVARRSPANSRYICAAAKCSFFSSSVSQFRTFFEENVRGFPNSLPVFLPGLAAAWQRQWPRSFSTLSSSSVLRQANLLQLLWCCHKIRAERNLPKLSESSSFLLLSAPLPSSTMHLVVV